MGDDAVEVMTQGMRAECEAEDPFPVPLPGLARVALVALEAAGLLPQWRPIEAAPKDGSVIRLWDGTLPFDGFWHVKEGRWRPAIIGRDLASHGHYANARNVAPTHWMPPPAPPEPR